MEWHGMVWTLSDSGILAGQEFPKFSDSTHCVFCRPMEPSKSLWPRWGVICDGFLASAVTAVTSAVAMAIGLLRGPQRRACCSPHLGQPVFGLRYAEVEWEENGRNISRQ